MWLKKWVIRMQAARIVCEFAKSGIIEQARAKVKAYPRLALGDSLNGCCPICGGGMVGDGYTSILRCENAVEDEIGYMAPDEGPVFCNTTTAADDAVIN